jgi:hypothetical protein
MKNWRIIVILTFCLVLMRFVSISSAAPLQWKIEDGGNGHYYDAVSAGVNWYDSCDAAKISEFMGYYGHLATITSAGENEFIVNTFPTAYYNGYWLGGFQPLGSEEWQWVSGEQWDYSNWAVGEPSNSGLMPGQPQEDGLCFREDIQLTFGSWNDWYRAGSGTDRGYVVEFPVPEPATILILGLGSLVLMRKSRSVA